MFKEMKMEFDTITLEVYQYLTSAWIAVNPFLKWFSSILVYILFPVESYMTYAQVVGVMVIFDLASKYYAISAKNGGLRNAIRIGKLSSNSMWVGTRKKIVSYFVVMVLVGLAYRFEAFQAPVEFMATLAYSIMFFREGQSILENMIEAGHKDLDWLLFLLRRKENELLGTEESDEENKKEKGDDEE